jgi:glycosyltransferase involved in cell wall biosynthesis
MERSSTSRLGRASTVLALVPHFNGERWLAACLDSLVCQTRPLDGIVVIDDCSPEPPVEIVRRFPQVTLLAAPENVGPYRLIQAAIDQTDHDAYLFQDADDWSTPDRLALLLDEAERSGAELVGTQGIRIICEEGEAVPYTFPLDVNAALTLRPTSNPLHHPTSLVARDLVDRLGGFATELRFSGDTEFLRRAAYVARIVNIPRYCYFYRTHGLSLTGHPETGLTSPARRRVMRAQHERARQNAERVARGEPPFLEPMAVAPPIRLHHLAGPRLCGTGGATWPT